MLHLLCPCKRFNTSLFVVSTMCLIQSTCKEFYRIHPIWIVSMWFFADIFSHFPGDSRVTCEQNLQKCDCKSLIIVRARSVITTRIIYGYSFRFDSKASNISSCHFSFSLCIDVKATEKVWLIEVKLPIWRNGDCGGLCGKCSSQRSRFETDGKVLDILKWYIKIPERNFPHFKIQCKVHCSV